MSIFNDDEEEDFTPEDSNNDKEKRIKQFLRGVYEDNDKPSINRRNKRKLIDVVLKLGIDSFISSFPKIIHSEFYDTLMIDLYNHYIESKFENLREIDIENIVYVVKHYEDDEEYEKCQDITKLYNNIEFRG
jgi:hypothetical protein